MIVLMTLVIGFVAIQKVEQHLIAATGESLALAAVDIADKLDRILYERYGDIQIMARAYVFQRRDAAAKITFLRSEEHTSELQSRPHLVCRLLLEKKKHTRNLPPGGPPASQTGATAMKEPNHDQK